jgi:hypothetical protein
MKLVTSLPGWEYSRYVFRLDNEAVVKRFKNIHRMNSREMHKQTDGDIWHTLKHMKSVMGDTCSVEWIRGHPEKRKTIAQFTAHERTSYVADKIADRYCRRPTPKYRRYPNNPEWLVQFEGADVTGNISRHTKHHIKKGYILRHLCKNRGWDMRHARQLDIDTLINICASARKRKRMGRHLQDMTGWLPSSTSLHKRDATIDDRCDLCGEEDTNDHILFECTHETLVGLRGDWERDVIDLWEAWAGDEMLDRVADILNIEMNTWETEGDNYVGPGWKTAFWHNWLAKGWEELIAKGVNQRRVFKKVMETNMKHADLIWRKRCELTDGTISKLARQEERKSLLAEMGRLRSRFQPQVTEGEGVWHWSSSRIKHWIKERKHFLARRELMKPAPLKGRRKGRNSRKKDRKKERKSQMTDPI